jgi:hypothetical protein
MELKLERKEMTDKSTIGELFIDGEFAYYTLEDKDRQLETAGCSAKVDKETCIPRGTYKVIIDDSTRFKRKMPHILDVDCFEGIRIHSGNYSGDTEGCILLGTEKGEDAVWHSNNAFNDFFPKLEKGLSSGEVWITIE